MTTTIANISARIRILNDKINRLLNKQWVRILFSAIVAAIPFVLIFMTYPVAFRGNDDYSIAATLQGNFTGEPQFYHKYVSVFLTAPLSLLYRIAPTVSWYPICMQIIIYISMVVILWSFITLALRNNVFIGIPVFAFLVLSLSVSSIAIAQLDFTRTTVFPAAAAISAMMTVDFKEKKKTAVKLIICGIMLFVSAIIRFSATLPIFLLFLVIVICRLFWLFIYERDSFKKSALITVIVTVSLTALLFCSNYVSNRIKYSQEKPEDTALINMVTHYRDYPHADYEEDPELYESIGWSESYTNLVNKWCFLDGKVNKDTMTALSKASNYESQTPFDDVLSNMKEYYRTPYLTTRYVFITCAFLTLIVAISIIFKTSYCKVRFREFVSDIFVIAVSWLSSAVMLLYLFYKGRYKEHALLTVCAPLLIICICVLLRTVFKPSARNVSFDRISTVIAVVLLYLIIGVLAFYTAKNHAYNATIYVYNEEYIKGPIEHEIDTQLSLVKMANENPDNFYICDSDLYMSMHVAYQDTYLKNHNLTIWGDSTYGTYASRKVFELNGLDYLTSESLFEDNVFILAKKECDINLINYMRETYGEATEAVLEYSDPDGYFNVYHFELVDNNS